MFVRRGCFTWTTSSTALERRRGFRQASGTRYCAPPKNSDDFGASQTENTDRHQLQGLNREDVFFPPPPPSPPPLLLLLLLLSLPVGEQPCVVYWQDKPLGMIPPCDPDLQLHFFGTVSSLFSPSSDAKVRLGPLRASESVRRRAARVPAGAMGSDPLRVVTC